MKQVQRLLHAPRAAVRSAQAGCILLLLLAPGCQRESEPAPGVSTSRSIEKSLFLAVAAAQSPRSSSEEEASPPARPARAAAGTGDAERARRRTAKAADGTEIEDETSRDFAKRTCLAAGCHGGLGQTPRVHGPVAVGACHLCHEAEGRPADHRFKLTRSTEELCGLCHRPADRLAVVHEPYGKFQCTGCHDPHGGNSTKFLHAESIEESCRTCHERRETAAAHKPVAEGDCLACHASHQSNFKHLLIADGNELCLGCHADLVKTFKESAHVHGAALEQCTKCHQAHGSEHAALLRLEPQQLCLECHEQTAQGAIGARSGHVFAKAGGAPARCSDCHRPHASDFEKLLVAPGGQVCFGCHDQEIKRPSGPTIPSVSQEIAAGKFLHEPVARGDCRSCHFAHFSSHASLLRSEYPGSFYAEFSESTYELCFSCHDRRLALEERTNRTQFRDGDRNLHFLHVNRKKGRTCGVCHEPHAGQQPALVRESVAFGAGSWALPIRFERRTTGGTCASGCHQQLGYDNTSPPPAPKDRPLQKSDTPGVSPGNDGE